MTDPQREFLRAAAASMASQSSRRILAAITEPLPGEQVTVQVNKSAGQQARETLAMAKIERLLELVTGSGINALSRIQSVAGQGAAFMANIIGNGRTPENSDEISRITDALLLLFQEHKDAGGGWPLPDDFGQATGPVIQDGPPGPSLWAREFPNDPPPSMDEIDDALTTPET